MATISSAKITNTVRTMGNERTESERVRPVKLVWAAPLVALIAAICTVAVRELGVAIGTIPADLQILQEAIVAASTLAFVVLGGLVFAIVTRFSARPVRTFRIVAAVALVLSFINPIGAGAGWMPVGATIGPATVATMMLMHVVAALVTGYLLPLFIREK